MFHLSIAIDPVFESPSDPKLKYSKYTLVTITQGKPTAVATSERYDTMIGTAT